MLVLRLLSLAKHTWSFAEAETYAPSKEPGIVLAYGTSGVDDIRRRACLDKLTVIGPRVGEWTNESDVTSNSACVCKGQTSCELKCSLKGMHNDWLNNSQLAVEYASGRFQTLNGGL